MPDVEWSTDDLAALPAWTLVQAYHAVAQGFGEIFAEHRLTPVQFGVLAQLAATPGLTQSQLARRVLIRPQSMGELIGTLVERGLLERHGPGGRGRPVPVTLTDQGRRTLASAGDSVRAFNQPSALGMSADEAATLNALLHKLIGSRQT
ncbi:MarR family winged helix-turn-helix transcriptional regulator [Antrihabitans cavernicola]|uniref:Winged helix-turn-helix transcriptional regulator n=1 Tax=Antrihabitans cavernicola TaxID=2495913 RepID=A0A5A7S6I2_9NOCA|nr:MarR family winged helix-turn-helix transcriptional regulator [Spelaeibacter cavernicola]KAA0016500.1 winged helix-turn-helix transcriptional regulator [Spelaeibacter cavernicola]